MRHITLVRHAQASFLEADYDQLRVKGERQARLLGKYWLRREVIFQKVYSGLRDRQRETSPPTRRYWDLFWGMPEE